MDMPAGEFKAKCLKIMETVAKYGKPVAKLVPVSDENKQGPFGYLQGTVTVKGDIIKPTAEKWHAEKE